MGNNGTSDPESVDQISRADKIVTNAHSKLHDGSAFHVSFSFTTANLDDQRSAIGFTTPDTAEWGHLVISVAVSDPGEVWLYEGLTMDKTEGTAQATPGA